MVCTEGELFVFVQLCVQRVSCLCLYSCVYRGRALCVCTVVRTEDELCVFVQLCVQRLSSLCLYSGVYRE